MIESLKNLYHYLWDTAYNAGSIVYARLTVIAGVLISAVSYADFSPLYALFGADTGFSVKQGFWTGVALLTSGVAQEVVRRRNTVVTESNKLVPSTITIPEVKAAKKNAK